MKFLVVAALFATTNAAINDPCSGPKDTCGDDAALCCGIATNGKVTDGEGKATSEGVPNIAVCNNAPVDGVSKATNVSGILDGANTASTKI